MSVGTVLEDWKVFSNDAVGAPLVVILLKFGYNIRIRMDPDAVNEEYQLETRHWRIRRRDQPPEEPPERVDGPGVIGLYPRLIAGYSLN